MMIDDKIADISKSILGYCLSRTSNSHDAEDLAQDIIVELIKSVDNLRNEKAFYGFMWGVAGNVCKQWYRKTTHKNDIDELNENITDGEDFTINIETESDIILLRRELSLLSEKYRNATVLYYMKNKSCTEISMILNISESMVKYLLFKSRKILKEGIKMNRSYGELSYDPKNLYLAYWGEGPNQFWKLTDGKLIPQNILWACYNDSLTGEEIALQIGVALPYLEKEIDSLIEAGLIIKNGNKHTTNVIILTKEYHDEVKSKIKSNQVRYAEMVNQFISEIKSDVMNLGIDFTMSDNTYKWQIVTKLLYEIYSNFTKLHAVNEMPVTAFGERAYVWGIENSEYNSIGICHLDNQYGKIQFFDWMDKPKNQHHHFYGNKIKIDLFLDIAINNKSEFTKYEEEIVVELIKQEYIVNIDGKLISTMPIFTESQINKLHEIFTPFYLRANKIIDEIMEIILKTLKNHAPNHLKNQVKDIAYNSACSFIFPDIIHIMINNNCINTNWDINEMPGAAIIRI